MKTVYLDSNVLIYLTQPQSDFLLPALGVLELKTKQGYKLVTSSFCLAECLAQPQDNNLKDDFMQLLTDNDIIEIPFDHKAALEFARLRASFGKAVSSPDAIHFACAKVGGANLFITNDQALFGVVVSGMKILPLESFRD